ncbi:MAG: hypothetical protein M1819_000950 [Sarea resinae]|nr:MAG: hypothetical protein M1819_000950 [Sarea resinae]
MGYKRVTRLLVISSDSEASNFDEDFKDPVSSPRRTRRSSLRKPPARRGRNRCRNSQSYFLEDAIVIPSDSGEDKLATHNGEEDQADDEDEEDIPRPKRRANVKKGYLREHEENIPPKVGKTMWFSHVEVRPTSMSPSKVKPLEESKASTSHNSSSPLRKQTSLTSFFKKTTSSPSARVPSSNATDAQLTRNGRSMPAKGGPDPTAKRKSARLSSPKKIQKAVKPKASPRRTQASLSASRSSRAKVEVDTTTDIESSSKNDDSEYVDPNDDVKDSTQESHLESNDETEEAEVLTESSEESEGNLEPVTPEPKRRKLQQRTLDGKKAHATKGKSVGRKSKVVGESTRGLGIDESLSPISHIDEIFDDMTNKAMELGLEEFTNHLNGRKLRVGTMCSGTESPILALSQFASSLKKHHNISLQIDHKFSAEIVPFKQAYIERNFSPPIIFRDIRELIDNDEATTAYGAKAQIPGEIDILIAGFSCVDFSRLNVKTLELGEQGESGDTFRAILYYCKVHRPKIVILENVLSAPWDEIRGLWADFAGYSAEYVKLDTKNYYLPHTRQRGYMICLDNALKGINARRAAASWRETIYEFKRKASSSVEAFLLNEDDPRVHRGREELARDARGDERSSREVDWTRCQGRHTSYRAQNGLGFKRTMTGWEDNGSCKMPDYGWGEWATAQVERIWDTLEISLLRNAKKGFDSQYKTRVWELSQNVDRFTDSTPFGITSCLTPTGSPYVTTRGGPMVGLEVLALQGLPIENLLLTRESQKQLQDLAGNAMSTTVVGAAILAALISGYKAFESGVGSDPMEITDDQQAFYLKGEEQLVEKVLDLSQHKSLGLETFCLQADHSARLCLCEGRASITPRKLQRCELCGHTTCEKCGGTPIHKYKRIPDTETQERIRPADFQDLVQSALPMRLKITGLTFPVLDKLAQNPLFSVTDKDWEMFTAKVQPALGVELRFQSVVRGQTWTVHYDAPTSHLELSIANGVAEWRLFAKPEQSEPVNSRVRLLLRRPYARMRPKGTLIEGDWQFCFPSQQKIKVTIKGVGSHQKSWEASLGLVDATTPVWSAWEVSVDPEDAAFLDVDVSGSYKSLPDCGKASGSLHKNISRKDRSPVFLFLDPTRLGDQKQDSFVFSTDLRRLNHNESRPIIIKLDPRWRPSDTEESEVVDAFLDGQWVACPALSVDPLLTGSPATYSTPREDLSIELSTNSCDAAHIMLTCKAPLENPSEGIWRKGDWVEVDKVSEQSILATFSWLTNRAKHIDALKSWRILEMPKDLARCTTCAPMPPPVRWKLIDNKALVPYEDPEKAAPYERALKGRPEPFVIQLRVDDDEKGQFRVGLNVSSLAHRVLANLAGGDSDFSNIELSWRLNTDYKEPSSKIELPKFRLLSNKDDLPCLQPPNFKTPLRPEQLRSEAWMIEQESDSAPPFIREEIEEAVLPQMGWRAEARARKGVTVRGGVLADQVGYGKTAITLGLIDSQFGKQASLNPDQFPGQIAVKATLVAAPTHLTHQWRDEITKFLGTKYRVLTLKAMGDLAHASIQHIMDADIIIVSWGLLNSETYLAKVAHFAAMPEMPSAAGRAFDEWYDFARRRLADHLDVLRHDGPKHLKNVLPEKLRSFEQNPELFYLVPSKRLRGKQYRDAKLKAKANGTMKKQSQHAGEKRKRKHGDTSEDESMPDEPSSSKSKPVRKGGVDPFDLGKAKAWKSIKSPLLQFFHFRRLVVDEYTYLEGKNHTCITSLESEFRWVLSGTPPLDDFADIKKIAGFIGIDLGVDDDTPGFIKRHNIKALQKDRTEVEKFQSFRQVRSEAWQMHRHIGVCQRFLDQHVRQNIAEGDEIPAVETFRAVALPAAERAIYLELQTHLMSQDLKVRKGRTRTSNDRERRLYQTLGESKSAKEALLKRCSHFTLDDLKAGQENAAQACDILVKERETQYDDLISEFRQALREAAWLKKKCKDLDKHFAEWLSNAESNQFGDWDATAALKELIASTQNKPCEPIETIEESMPASKKPAKSGKGKAKDSSVVIQYPFRNMSVEETTQNLRERSHALRRLTTELISRVRSLRFIKAVREVQLSMSGLKAAAATRTCACSRCLKSNFPAAAILVLSSCGHTTCEACWKEYRQGEACVVDRCGATVKDYHVHTAEELGEEDERARKGKHYGKKLEDVLDLIKTIPKDDQVLLFAQFDDLMERVSNALQEHQISFAAITQSKVKQAAGIISAFQKDIGKAKKKVLVLNVADESASGANLTNANHVIFLSPLLAETQQKYEANMTQAIGRARRYGQKKCVHIHHFLSLKTIDVNILQERKSKRLVQLGNDYKLLDKDDPRVEGADELGTKELAKHRSYASSESER